MERKLILVLVLILVTNLGFAQKGKFKLSVGADAAFPEFVWPFLSGLSEDEEDDNYFGEDEEELECYTCFFKIGGLGFSFSSEYFLSDKFSFAASASFYPSYSYHFDTLTSSKSIGQVISYALDIRRYFDHEYVSIGYSEVSLKESKFTTEYGSPRRGFNISVGGDFKPNSRLTWEAKIQSAHWLMGWKFAYKLFK